MTIISVLVYPLHFNARALLARFYYMLSPSRLLVSLSCSSTPALFIPDPLTLLITHQGTCYYFRSHCKEILYQYLLSYYLLLQTPIHLQ